MSNVINLPVVTTLDLPPERVLQAAIDAGLKGVVVLGYDADDQEYMASSIAGGPEVVWLMERCKRRLLSTAEDDE